ncbi:NHL repeat-containing protein 2 [Scaptodrosophila lebanonensis]|uniref:NHL repeat-containing protein 2 n=1 Tax=Drosophila lebanonensis TaxID=7225 RepID=A0A6J2U335_DROLE|nr:NHL repeat-containing protein 2 [Scaptodrosophila lebanonensis]
MCGSKDIMENLDSPIDIVTYVTEELQKNYRSSSDKVKVFQDFFKHWEVDTSIAKVKATSYEFESDLDWFNVSRPLSLAGLRGKIVVLDFFTYCCINCMHVLPELKALEQRYPVESGLVVVGVHSPKFENERDTGNILSASLRYGITHPILNDYRSKLWRAIGIRCWPSMLVLSPNGNPMLLLMGEGHQKFLQEFIGVALAHFDRKQKIDHCSLPLQISSDLRPASNLRFPSKIARSPQGRYAVADAGNNRVVVFSDCGVVEHKIGGAEAGFVDGNVQVARFNNPQGVAFLDEHTLVVADTENHALRKISLKDSLVETLAGTGLQGHERTGGRIGPLQSLSSPWDVAVYRKRDMDMSFHLDEHNVPEKTIILVAMAGTHQIWGYFPEGIIWWKFRKFEPRCCVSLIGNGLEENRNNSYPQNAAFAQPSGLTIAEDYLFIADSESSSIRKASMVDGKVMPVVGGDRNPQNLFAFGDVDGKLFNAKLQHPLGVAYNNADKVYVADTYNHKIKVIDISTNTVSTLVIKNEKGEIVSFKEPAGLCTDSSGRQLLVSDTNNHQIILVNLDTLTARNFALDFGTMGSITETDAFSSSINKNEQLQKSVPLSLEKSTKIGFSVKLLTDLKFTEEAPQKWTLKSLSPHLEVEPAAGVLINGQFSIKVVPSENIAGSDSKARETDSDLLIEIVLNLCDTKCCLMKRFSVALLRENNGDEKAAETPQHVDIKIIIDHAKISLD